MADHLPVRDDSRQDHGSQDHGGSDSGHDGLAHDSHGESYEYADEYFESDILSPSRGGGGDRVKEEEGAEDNVRENPMSALEDILGDNFEVQ